MHISDAPSGQELDEAGCGSRGSYQKQAVFMLVFFCIFSRSSLSVGLYGATKELLNLINIYQLSLTIL